RQSARLQQPDARPLSITGPDRRGISRIFGERPPKAARRCLACTLNGFPWLSEWAQTACLCPEGAVPAPAGKECRPSPRPANQVGQEHDQWLGKGKHKQQCDQGKRKRQGG